MSEIVAVYDEHTGMNADDRMAIAEFKHEHMRDPINIQGRLAYLRQVWRVLKDNDMMLDIQADAYKGLPIVRVVALRHVRTLDRMTGVLREVMRLKRPLAATTGDMTPVMKVRALEYPIEQILANHGYTPERGGNYLCVYHVETRASMSAKRNNRIKCFSCGKSDDAIGLEMHLSGDSFPVAVRRLAQG